MLKELTEEEKTCLVPTVDRVQVGEVAFEQASGMLHQARTELWKKLKEMYPTANHLSHPDDGKWTVSLDDSCVDDEKEP